MDIATQMMLFAKVVDHANFSAAARSIGMSPSAVSKQISNLENRLGVRLLNRSTRHVAPTEEGRYFHRHCARVAHEVAAAEEIAAVMSGHPVGRLKLACTVAFGKAQLLPLLPDFLARYPEISLDLELTDRNFDIVTEDFDLTIRFREQIRSESLIVRKIADSRRIVCAARSYTARRGIPLKPADLAGHNCLRMSTIDDWNDWHFDEDGTKVTIAAQGNFKANSADAIYHAALNGLGIARLPTYMVSNDIRMGRLMQLLPEHIDDDSGIFAVYSSRYNVSPKVRVLIDFLISAFNPVPPWEMPASRAKASRSP